MKKTLSILLMLLLPNCFGPTLFTIPIGATAYNVNIIDLITAPKKIEKILPNKEEKEDYENKKL